MKSTNLSLHTDPQIGRTVGLDSNGTPLILYVDVELTTSSESVNDVVWKIIGFDLYSTSNHILQGNKLIIDVYDSKGTLIKGGVELTSATNGIVFDSAGNLPDGDTFIYSESLLGKWTIRINTSASTIGNGEYWEAGGGRVDEAYYSVPDLYNFTIEKTGPLEITASAVRNGTVDPYTPVSKAEIFKNINGGSFSSIAVNDFNGVNTAMYNITTSDEDIQYGNTYGYYVILENTTGSIQMDTLYKTIKYPEKYAYIM